MTDAEIIQQVKKAYKFMMDGTYDSSEDMISHIMQIIRDEKQALANRISLIQHLLEKLLHLIEEYRLASRDIAHGQKHRVKDRTSLGKQIDMMVLKLHSLGYNTDRFKEKYKTEQKDLFNG